MLASCHRPDRQGAILAEISVTSTASDEEQGSRFLEEKRAGRRPLIGLGALISTSHGTDSRNRHLSIQAAFDGMVHLALQGQRIQRRTTIKARLREGLLHFLKHLKSTLQ